MRELIKITEQNGTQAVSARELYNFLQVPSDFTHWCKRMFDYGFVEEQDYSLVKIGERSAHNKTDYALTLDTAKEIAMLQRTERGKQARQYFIECERQLAAQIQAPRNYKEALIHLLRSEEEKEMLTQQNSLLIAEKALSQPKVEFYDTVTKSADTFTMREVAKILNIEGVGQNKLFELLRNRGVLMFNNEPYQRYVDAGWFKCIETTYLDTYNEIRVSRKTVVFQKGVDGIRKLLIRNFAGA